MKVLAEIGTLNDGRTVLMIQDAYNPNYVVVSNYDREAQSWDSGTYFDGNLTSLAEYITDVNKKIGYSRMEQIAKDYISQDIEARDDLSYVALDLEQVMCEGEIRELGFDWVLDAAEDK